VVSACRRAGVAFSVTARKNAGIRRVIAAIPDKAWTPIPYWLDDGADVAETTYTAFADTRHETTARLLVRRVRPTPGSQLALDVVFDYHAILTNRDGPLLEVEADHRRHAVVEHVIDDLKHHAGLAHLPSGRFAANAAWLTLVGVAYHLARWTASATGLGRVHHQDAAADDHRRTGPAGALRPPVATAPTQPMALGRPDPRRPRPVRPDARTRLTRRRDRPSATTPSPPPPAPAARREALPQHRRNHRPRDSSQQRRRVPTTMSTTETRQINNRCIRAKSMTREPARNP
jgi:hypothetical protein